MHIVFLNDCAADGCYRKKCKGSMFCKKCKQRFDAAEEMSVGYGKKIQKKAGVNK